MVLATLVTPATFSYIMGNPPFIGASMMTAEQKNEAVAIFGKGKRVNSIDYVGAWYHKAAKLIQGSETRVAFVSCNSITQGEQVAPLWQPLFENYGIEIDFAWRTFRWNNEAQAKAHVHCVIVGFHVRDQNLTQSSQSPQSGGIETSRTSRTSRELKIYDGDKVIEAEHINVYLMDGPDVWVESRTKPICDVPPFVRGCQPTDDGNFILTLEEKEKLLANEPQAKVLIRPFMMGQTLFNANRDIAYG